MLPRPKPSDPLVIAAANLVAGWLHHGSMPLDAIAGEVLRQYERLQHINQHRKAAWQDVPLGPDVLDAIPIPQAGEPQPSVHTGAPRIKAYPPPVHPLAQRGVSQAEKIDGTVTAKAITCLECGKQVTLLLTHLRAKHDGMTKAEYLDRHGLPADYPVVAQEHKDRQSAQMKKYRTSGKRLSEDELVRKPSKKKRAVKREGELFEPVEADFSSNKPRNRSQSADDDGLGKTG